jgi:acetyltransferase-like isoleucine patch superfamily enzyme
VQPLRKLRRGEGCLISPTATFAHAERIALGNNVLIGEDCRLWAGPSEAQIFVGSDVMLGPGILITAASYRFMDGTPIREQVMSEAGVSIGSDSWIGAGAIVLPGANIGAGCVIGAGAVVRGTIPPMSIAVGVPARVTGQRVFVAQSAAVKKTFS